MAWGITGYHAGDRQAYTYNLKAGQKRGMGVPHVVDNNIVIYNKAPQSVFVINKNTNKGTSKLETWLLGLGTLFGGIGAIASASKGTGSVEGAGGSEEEEKTKEKEPEKTEEKEPKKDANLVTKKAAAQSQEVAAVKAASQALETAKTDFTNGQTVRVHDEKLGDSADISGTVTNNADGTISIKDVLNTYTYKKEANTVNYKGVNYPVYTLIGAVDSTTGQTKPITTQQYILVNGQLIQPSDLDMTGLGFGSVKKNNQ